ncbi:MAG: TIM-barrel domain-containing protein [Bryobacteraceae bacterium]|jgi:alpha-glucosidase
MTRSLIVLACCTLSASIIGPAGFTGFKGIGAVASARANGDAVTIVCTDQSQVRIEILASDLIRVRAAFGKALPEGPISAAIASSSWEKPRWSLSEGPDSLVIATSEIEVLVHRSPLLIDFRDPATHEIVNSDQQPMMYDPKTGAVAAAKKLGFDEHFYGLGEKAARLDKRRGQFTMWNSDTPRYKEGTDPLYQSIPFYIGWQSGRAYGIFYDNSYRTHFDLGHNSEEYAAFVAEGGAMDYYFFQGPSIRKILGRYADLTGHMPLPPMWALGHQQSRYSYYPDKLVENVVDRYRADDLPLDAVHLDLDYMNGHRVFTWDPKRFPDPRAFTARLARQGVRVVTIVDPGIKYQPPEPRFLDGLPRPELAEQDKNYYVYTEGAAGGYFLKRADGSLYLGTVWPGKSVFVDYSMDAAARWWGGLFRAYLDQGVAGIWTDMNEPSDFDDQTGESQKDVVTWDGGARTLQDGNRNLFALRMARATYEGLERLRPEQRPYVITRAGYAGIQRYATTWTGDNTATWEALALSLPMLASLGLSGEPFVGADVGGFGAGRPDGEMLTRWYQVGFLTPFLRNHAELGVYDHEPWRFGAPYEDIIRKYLKLRYRLLPFLYSALEEAQRTGVPVFRPLLLNYQDDANTVSIDDEFMAGDGLLVAPILKPDVTSRLVYLPKGTWFDYWTGTQYNGGRMIRAQAPLETVPLYVRGGAILPLGPEMNWVGEKPCDPLTFQIYPDDRGQASFSLYEDDGISPAYRRGVFRRTAIQVSRTGEGSAIAIGRPTGTWQPSARHLVFLLNGRSSEIADDGKEHRLTIR